MRFAPLALAILVTALPIASPAQDHAPTADEQILLDRIQNDKRNVYAEYLDLSTTEAEAFWPVYDEYEARLEELDTRFIALVNEFVENFDSLTDEKAREILVERLAIERKRVDLKVKYTDRIAAVVPGRKALRYAQLESRIENVRRRNLYLLIPLAH